MTANRSMWDDQCPSRGAGLTHAHWNECSTKHIDQLGQPLHADGECCHCGLHRLQWPGAQAPQPADERTEDVHLPPAPHPYWDESFDEKLVIPAIRMVAHPRDMPALDFHVIGMLSAPHMHAIIEEYTPDQKNRLAAHIARWHFRV